MNVVIPWLSPLLWQRRVMRWREFLPEARHLTVATGRQTGKTELAVELAYGMAEASGSGDVNGYITPNYPLGTKPFRGLSELAERHAIGKANKGERVIAWMWGPQTQFKTGDRPGDIVGETYRQGVVYDEGGRMHGEVWDYSMPMLRVWSAASVAVGTPRGKNRFYERFKRGCTVDGQPFLNQMLHQPAECKPPIDPLYVSFRAPSWVAPWWDDAAIREAHAVMPERLYRQEIEAEFLEGAASLFGDFLQVCTEQPRGPEPDGLYVLGADLGKLADFTSVRVFRVDTRIPIEVQAVRFQGNWHTQRQKVFGLAQQFNEATVVVDATGLGEPVCDELEAMGLRIERFKFTGSSKLALIDNLVAKIATRQIRLLSREADPVAFDEMADFEYEIVPTKGAVVGEPNLRYGHPEGSHDDTVMARALALQAVGAWSRVVPFA